MEARWPAALWRSWSFPGSRITLRHRLAARHLNRSAKCCCLPRPSGQFRSN